MADKSLVRLLWSQLSPSIEDNMFLYETCLLHVGSLYLGLDLINESSMKDIGLLCTMNVVIKVLGQA